MSESTTRCRRLSVRPGWDEGTGVMVVRVNDYGLTDQAFIGGAYETYFDRALVEARGLGWEHTGYVMGKDALGEAVEVHTFEWNSAILDHAEINMILGTLLAGA